MVVFTVVKTYGEVVGAVRVMVLAPPKFIAAASAATLAAESLEADTPLSARAAADGTIKFRNVWEIHPAV